MSDRLQRFTFYLALALWLAIFAGLKFLIAPPIPASVLMIYMVLASVAILVFVAANEARFSAFLAPNSAGTLSLALPIPSITGPPCLNFTISTQAAVINPCGLGVPGLVPGPFVLTQGYTLNF